MRYNQEFLTYNPMDALTQFIEQTFSSLKIRNYRIYFIGQGFSHIGNWMQTVALGWLVLELTGSGAALGTVLAFRFAPMLLGGPFAGIIVDRFDKRRLLYITQWSFVILTLLLSLLVYTGFMQVWMLFLFAVAFGLIDVVDNPSRQTFVHELVGRDNLRNAVTLNATEANLARALGPMIAGSLIAGVGIAFCFLANAFSFLVIIFALSRMRSTEFHHEEAQRKSVGNLFEGLSYVASVPLIRSILIAMAVIGTLSYEFQVSLPLLAHDTFNGAAGDYAALFSAMGAGAVFGGLFAASRKKILPHEFIFSAFLLGISMCVAAAMPTVSLATIGMIFVGFFFINVNSLGNTIIQLEAAPHMRGRVMSLWSMAIFGSTLVGAPIVGLTGQYIGPRWGLVLGGVAAMAAAAYTARALLKKNWFRIISEKVGLATQEVEAENLKV